MGFYSYYAPRGTPYTDYLNPGKPVDYQVVYPGVNGPVTSRQAEAFREGWEDYRLLSLIRSEGSAEAKAVMNRCLEAVPMGREPSTTGVDFEGMRVRFLRAMAE